MPLRLRRGSDVRARLRDPDYHGGMAQARSRSSARPAAIPSPMNSAASSTHVATPHYAVDGCDGPNYRSIIFAREHAPACRFRGRRAAVQQSRLHVGHAGAEARLRAHRRGRKVLFGDVIETGGHFELDDGGARRACRYLRHRCRLRGTRAPLSARTSSKASSRSPARPMVPGAALRDGWQRAMRADLRAARSPRSSPIRALAASARSALPQWPFVPCRCERL